MFEFTEFLQIYYNLPSLVATNVAFEIMLNIFSSVCMHSYKNLSQTDRTSPVHTIRRGHLRDLEI